MACGDRQSDVVTRQLAELRENGTVTCRCGDTVIPERTWRDALTGEFRCLGCGQRGASLEEWFE